MFCPVRENGSCDRTGDSAAGDGSERGALSLPESPDRTPSPRGEVRRPEGGDGFIGEEHTNTHLINEYERFNILMSRIFFIINIRFDLTAESRSVVNIRH